MSENKAFTLKLDIKVYSNLSAIIFSTNQRSLVFGNRGVIPSEAPKLSQANIRVCTQHWSFKMWEQQAWFKCASHHLGAKKSHLPNISCPSRFATVWKNWVNNYKNIGLRKLCLHGRVLPGLKTQRWWLSKKSSLFWAVYGFCFIQRPLPTSKTKWFCEKQAQHTGYCTQLWCWPHTELHEGQTLSVLSQQRPKPVGFVVTSIEQLLAGTGAVLDKPLLGCWGGHTSGQQLQDLKYFHLQAQTEGWMLSWVLTRLFLVTICPLRGRVNRVVSVVQAPRRPSAARPCSSPGDTHPYKQAERAATKKNKCPQLSPGLTRSQQKLFPPPVGCPCLQRGFLPLTGPLPPLAPTAMQYSVEKNM